MSEELQQPPVIDLEVLLRPISDDAPSGESLRYSGLYDEIAEARRADDQLNMGAWQSEAKAADYRRVVDLSIGSLSTQTKDLQIAAWLSESLVKLHGFAGLRDSLLLMAGLQENFWETLYPEIDEGDMEGRANAISWLDTQTALAAKQVPITGGPGYGFLDWEDSKRFDFPEGIDSLSSDEQQKWADLRTQADTEKRVTAELWRKAKAQTRRKFCEEVNFVLGECAAALAQLNSVIEEKYDRNQMPGVSNMRKALDDVHTQVKRLLEEKRIEEPDESDFQSEEVSGNGDGAGGFSIGGSVQSRKDALKRLEEIALFFQRTEPHSPVAYLVQRAVKWGNMPLDNWLREVIKDENVLFSVRETLGLDVNGSSLGESSGETSGSEW